jgi:hypothetical protein
MSKCGWISLTRECSRRWCCCHQEIPFDERFTSSAKLRSFDAHCASSAQLWSLLWRLLAFCVQACYVIARVRMNSAILVWWDGFVLKYKERNEKILGWCHARWSRKLALCVPDCLVNHGRMIRKLVEISRESVWVSNERSTCWCVIAKGRVLHLIPSHRFAFFFPFFFSAFLASNQLNRDLKVKQTLFSLAIFKQFTRLCWSHRAYFSNVIKYLPLLN